MRKGSLHACTHAAAAPGTMLTHAARRCSGLTRAPAMVSATSMEGTVTYTTLVPVACPAACAMSALLPPTLRLPAHHAWQLACRRMHDHVLHMNGSRTSWTSSTLHLADASVVGGMQGVLCAD
jgi:hypothetical protein